MISEYGKDFHYRPSTLFLYYVTRSLEGTVDVDAGATIRNTIKAANEFGVATEKFWPYTKLVNLQSSRQRQFMKSPLTTRR